MASAQEEFDNLMRDKSRRDGHPEDDTNGQSFLDLSDNDNDDDTQAQAHQSDVEPETAQRTSISSFRSTIPRTRFHSNTGPKGVIADAQHWRDSRRSQRIAGLSTADLAAQAQALSLNGHSNNNHDNVGVVHQRLDEEEEDDMDDMDDVDEDFMEQWRRSRIQQLQSGIRERQTNIQGRGRRAFGGLTTVDGEGYLDAVDKSPTDTVVIVYIYDDQSDVSTSIERCLRTLAAKHQDTRFVRLHYEDAQMEPAGVPALLAYRGGDKFAGLVPMIDELPDDADLSATTIETVLKRQQILR